MLEYFILAFLMFNVIEWSLVFKEYIELGGFKEGDF